MEPACHRIGMSLAIAVIAIAASLAAPVAGATAQPDKAAVLKEYRLRRAALNVEDRDQWYVLAKWLDENDQNDLALEVLNEMIQRYPDHKRGLILRHIVLNRLADTDTRDDTPKRKKKAEPKDTTRREDDRLTPKQINLIKIWELNFSTRPRVVVSRKTIDEMFQKYAHRSIVPKGIRERRRFRGLKDYKQAKLLIELDARDLLKDVQAIDEPTSLRKFRQSMHLSYVLSYCGTRHCHGGDDAAAFRLFRARPKDERTAYTNFFILNRYESSQGYMIDRDQPELSLLTQYGLTPDDSNIPHPQTDNWRPFFRNRSDPRLVRILQWVHTLAEPLRVPNYGVAYKAPAARKVTAPPAVPPGTNDEPPPAAESE